MSAGSWDLGAYCVHRECRVLDISDRSSKGSVRELWEYLDLRCCPTEMQASPHFVDDGNISVWGQELIRGQSLATDFEWPVVLGPRSKKRLMNKWS